MPHQTVNDIQLYYELHGPDNAHPVVLVNGLLSDTTSWAYQIPVLAQHFRVLTYDCRGQGQSDKPAGPYSQELHARDLAGLLRVLGIRKTHLFGISNGGTVAMTLALNYPDYVERLVLVDTFAYADVAMQAKLRSWLVALETGGPIMRFDVASPWVWGRDFIADNRAIMEELRSRAESAQVAAQTLIEGTLEYDIRHRLHQISVPTLVLVGAEDVLTPPWYSQQVADLIPDTRMFVLPRVGHVATIEAPGTVNALALAFLRGEM
jgi:3-oxoadipate enol-lactonase